MPVILKEGDTHGKWTVVKKIKRDKKWRHTYYLVQCVCGAKKKVRGDRVSTNPECQKCERPSGHVCAVKGSFDEYQLKALRTEKILPADTPIDLPVLWMFGRLMVHTGNLFDQYKRRLFYGKVMDMGKVRVAYEGMSGLLRDRNLSELEYDPHVPSGVDLRVIHGVIGLVTETGELVQTLLRGIINGGFTEEDNVNLVEELGDLCWYLALIMAALGLDFYAVLRANNAKLEKRFGLSYSQDKVLNRDTDAEMVALKEALK